MTEMQSTRRRRLCAVLTSMRLEAALITNPKHIFYFSGVETNIHPWQTLMKGPRTTSFLLVREDGSSSILLPASENVAGGNGALARSSYADYDMKRRFVPYGGEVAEEMKTWLKKEVGTIKRVGVEEWHIPQAIVAALSELNGSVVIKGISGQIIRLRRAKDRDEVRSVRAATRIVEFCFQKAREVVHMGSTELDVYAEVNKMAFAEYGHATWINGDFASGERSVATGGPPTSRVLRRGETLILDIHAQSNNYWSDLCRTFVVGRSTSVAQRRALAALKEAKQEGEKVLVPGTKGREVYEAISRTLESAGYSALPHHAGHGIGLDDQEWPWFIPGDEGELVEGAVVALEPGVYSDEFGGIRIEDIYVVEGSGPRKISRFPLDIA